MYVCFLGRSPGVFFFFFQAEDGIRDLYVTGVQTCALPISKISESRYQVGKGMQQDVLRSQVEISLLLQKLTMLDQQRATSQAKLNNLLVRQPESPLPPAADVQPTAMRYSLEELYAMAAESDTGVQRESRMVERNQLAVALAQKEYRPDLGVGYMYQQRPSMPDMHAVTFTV